MVTDPTDLEERVRASLDEVLDPCSTFTERPQSVLALGLVDEVDVDDGDVTVHLLPTNQLCMYIPHMTEEIETRVRELPSVESISVEIVADDIWTQDRMTRAARQERDEYFQERVEAHGITPAYDGESWSDGSGAKMTRRRDD